MKKSTIWLLVLIMALTFIGLLSMQISYMENMAKMLEGEPVEALVMSTDERYKKAYEACSAMAYERIYCAPYVVDVDLAGNKIVSYLLDVLMDAVLHPEKNYSKLLLSKIPKQYDVHSKNIYNRIQAVLDHVSGMTDIYALDLFRKLNGHSLPAV